MSNHTGPTLDEELAWLRQGMPLVAGLDEAGRGSWAGPVAAAAVVLPLQRLLEEPDLLEGVDDSKRLPAPRRELLAGRIAGVALGVGLGLASPALVDALGVVAATRLAMRQALGRLPLQPQALLIDALSLPSVPLPQWGLVRGDMRCLSIAAASIVAKVARDRLMVSWDEHYPHYGFARHKGYGTPQHRQALQHYGPCALHRRSFAPLRVFLETGRWPAR
ncbi:MAG: ribonuclease HII [Chloroflexia bacterium]|nr:ribonuclease HII [Chloroflexia bacterium]